MAARGPPPAAPKPNFLILGGCGFIGRNLVKYLLDNGIAGAVRVADKKAPFMSFLSADHKAALLGSPEVVECVQVDLAEDDMVDTAFAEPRSAAAAPGSGWDYVVLLASETGHGKKEEFYAKGVAAAAKCGAAAVASGCCRKFVHVSTAAVYKPEKKAPRDETARVEPWNSVADYSWRAEEALRGIAGLPLVVLRPASVYGPGDHASLMPRCVIAATYKATAERMDFLWDGDLRASTVHVFDVVRAIYHCARKVDAGSVYNLADKGETDQTKLAAVLGAVFSIETGFVGTMKSNLAALKLDTVVDVANENHLSPWLSMLKKHGIANTPLTPYLHKALLAHNHLCVDGARIEATGFKYAVPLLTPESLAEQVKQAIAQGIFPPVL